MVININYLRIFKKPGVDGWEDNRVLRKGFAYFIKSIRYDNKNIEPYVYAIDDSYSFRLVLNSEGKSCDKYYKNAIDQ